ncbi:hypothetical protein RVS70_07595 [Virgibacillus sp. M23]|uniref:hypothetical protein n=1 Tax=Virgibacillus sp. M23 TaxID=3079030 RepID=UPI002A90B896|nr:hypothetical protein [Virgibacillus sp. M23]MDY7044069.1 hypothetical protein [Virgibacillus sp. M23]
MSEKIPAAKHLQEHELKMLKNTHEAHNQAMGTEERKHYSLDNIKKVKRNFPERCFEVYFRNGEWFKYYINGTWG